MHLLVQLARPQFRGQSDDPVKGFSFNVAGGYWAMPDGSPLVKSIYREKIIRATKKEDIETGEDQKNG